MLKRLQSSSPHVCVLLGCGRTDKINYIVMSLLGPNLSELRKQQPKQKFSLSTTLRVGIQVIAAIRAMHNCGFLHRDIKPSNFAIGASSVTKRTCYMLDFGLARQFTGPKGETRPPRPVAGFRGTVRYASINAHQSKDLGRHDDLWSVFYMLVELANSELPWKKIRDKEKAGKFKMSHDHRKLLKFLPSEFYDFLDHLKSLTYFQEPDYILLSTLLQNATRYLGIKRSDPFDWEHDLSGQSLTTISAGSAPALRTNNEMGRRLPKDGGKDVVDGGESRTNFSVENVSLSQNAEKRTNKKECQSPERCGEKAPLGVEENMQGSKAGVAGIHRVSNKTQKENDSKQPQQRKTMPPSPLLQATHLAHNDSGSARADSLDRFFDMKVGGSRSSSHSSKSSSRSKQRGSNKERESDIDSERQQNGRLEFASRSSEGKSSSRRTSVGKNGAQRNQHCSRSKSESLKESPSIPSKEKPSTHATGEAPQDDEENKATGLHLLDMNKSDGKESKNGDQSSSSKSRSQHSELRYSSFEQGRSVGSIAVHPETTAAPLLGYRDSSSPPAPTPTTTLLSLKPQSAAIETLSAELQNRTNRCTSAIASLGMKITAVGDAEEEISLKDLRIEGNGVTPRILDLTHVVLGSDDRVGTWESGEEDGVGRDDRVGTWESGEEDGAGREEESPLLEGEMKRGERKRETEDNSKGSRRLEGGDESLNRRKKEHLSFPPQDSDHRQKHGRIQSDDRRVKESELLPLYVEEPSSPPRGRGKYSPGPPPLEFSADRPQLMWGQDSTSRRGNRIADGLVVLPHPPDYPPPQNYTLLTARRKRFRRPAKT